MVSGQRSLVQRQDHCICVVDSSHSSYFLRRSGQLANYKNTTPHVNSTMDFISLIKLQCSNNEEVGITIILVANLLTEN